MPKKLILSVTTSDFEWKFIRGSGPGGQHRNKVSTGCRCTHRDSGAVGVATNSKSQKTNRKEAFLKCTRSEKFQSWLRMEIAKRTGEVALVEAEVDRSLSSKGNLRIEVKKDGRWTIEDKVDTVHKT